MKVVDDYGNETIEPVIIEVYAPIPTIDQADLTGSVIGSIDEAIALEPIHLFRVREGE